MHIPVSPERPWLDAKLQAAHWVLQRHFGKDGLDAGNLWSRLDVKGALEKVSLKFFVLALVLLFFTLSHFYTQWKRKVNVPYVTAGRGPYWIRAWRTAIQWIINGKSLVDKGYYKHKHETKIGAFQIPTLSGNHVFICSDKLVEEFRNAPSDQLSFGHATADILQAHYTIGTDIFFQPYHKPCIRDQLTRALDGFTPQMMEEFTLAMENHMDLRDGEWKALKAYDLCAAVIARGMSRIFVGPELCQNKEYLASAIDFTQQLFIAAHVLHLIPLTLLKYIISPFINALTINKHLKTTKGLLAPLIEERKRRASEEGPNWKGKPVDMLQWILEAAPPSGQGLNSLIMRMMEINMSGLHTAGITLYQALFRLVLYPEHIPELRKEMEENISNHGWNKGSMSKMVKLDSFMKETQRLQGPSICLMGRKVLGKGFTFSNGLHLPPGVTVSIPETVHTDEKEYGSNAEDFDGFRFSRPVEEVMGKDQAQGTVRRKYFVTTGLNYLRFGHGHGACPGRFYAAYEIKIILCLLLINFDIRLEDTPNPMYFTMHRVPDMNARIAFRRRKI